MVPICWPDLVAIPTLDIILYDYGTESRVHKKKIVLLTLTTYYMKSSFVYHLSYKRHKRFIEKKYNCIQEPNQPYKNKEEKGIDIINK